VAERLIGAARFSHMAMKLSDYIIEFLAREGVKHIFLLPGGGCMHLTDSVAKNKNVSFVACLHEQGAAIAADGYAQYSRSLGVALVTTGPGSTNAITGVAGSWIESVPVLILSGQVKTPDIKPSADMRMMGFQEVDITPMVKPVTKYAVTIMDPESVRFHMEKAVYLARTGRPGPVWINVPLDIQAREIDPEKLRPFDRPAPAATADAPLKAAATRALDLLAQSTRPVILAGYGVKLARAEELLLEVLERLGVPVLLTWKGADLLPEEHPLFFGRPGTLALRGANFIQQNSDFILTIGARLDFGQIGYASETFARAAKKVIVDIDPLELNKFRFAVDLPVAADAGDFLREIKRQIDGFVRPDLSAWFERCHCWKLRYPAVAPAWRTQETFVNSYVLVEALSRLMKPGDLLVPGSSGACSDISLQTFQFKMGQRALNSPGIGAMGFGLPQSMGACVASGKRTTVCVNGDGGFQLNIQELETVRRLDLPVKYFVLNNNGYASMRLTHRNYFSGRLIASDPSSGLTLPNVRRQADAYGIANNRIENHSHLDERIREVLEHPGPFIAEVMVDPEEQTQPKVKSVLTVDGRMVSKPLEDLAPFLERREFLENMIIPPLPE
jgi:acetolactate synthase I/II/III large subunit